MTDLNKDTLRYVRKTGALTAIVKQTLAHLTGNGEVKLSRETIIWALENVLKYEGGEGPILTRNQEEVAL